MSLNIDATLTKVRANVNMKTHDGRDIVATFDTFLYGAIIALAKKRLKNWHGVILITGEVGDGKSTLADGICALDAHIMGKKYDLNNVVFSTTDFEEFCDAEDNFYEPLKYDEAIEGATNQDMARSSKGLSFKKKIVQKRKKKHLYVMCIDELEEYAWKLIKMANIWIHVKSYGLRRGYFDITTTPWKIKAKYILMKNKRYQEAYKIYPDKMNCTYMDYTNLFIDDDEYQKKKDEETKSNKDKPEDVQNQWILNMLESGMSQMQVAKITGKSRSTISYIKNKLTTK